MLHLALLAATLFGGLGQGLPHRAGFKFPFLDVIDLTTNTSAIPWPLDGLLDSLRPRDDSNSDSYSFLFSNGGCDGAAVYGAYGKVDRSVTCVNLVTEKDWDTITLGLGSQYDFYEFAGPDCCTSGTIQPCSIYKGDTSAGFGPNGKCISSAGPPDNTGNHFARSVLIDPHYYTQDDGSATQQACARPLGGTNCPLCRSDEKRDAGCSRANDGLFYDTTRSGNTTNFGNQNPADIIRQMADRCGDTGCNAVQFNIDNVAYDTEGASNTDSTGRGSEDGTLVVQIGGSWMSGEKQNYVDGLALLGSNSTAIEKTIITQQGGQTAEQQGVFQRSVQGTFYSAMDGLRVDRRFRSNNGDTFPQGYAQIKVTFKKDKDDTCEFITNLVSNVAGAVNGVAGGFFGEAGSVLCNEILD